jgi:RNA polymerase sigma factor (sigma-70 family)
MLTDAVLVERVIAGFDDAFDELYRRHATTAWRLAQAVTGNPHDAADAVSEAFARVLQAVRAGRLDDGDAFRSYLLTATRNAALDGIRRSGRSRPTEDEELAAVESGAPSPDQRVAHGADAVLVATAFRNLPERWRSVLWLTEVEGIATKDAAEQLGLSANGAAQLAVRARAGLRERYLQAHLRDAGHADCRFTIDRLGAYVGGGLSARDIAKVDQHLAGCESCSARKAELEDVGTSLRRIALPIPIGLAGLAGTKVKAALAASTSAAPASAGLGARVAGWAKEPTPMVRRLVGASAAGVLGLGVLAASFVGSPGAIATDLTAPKLTGPLRQLDLPDAQVLAGTRLDLPTGSTFTRSSLGGPTISGPGARGGSGGGGSSDGGTSAPGGTASAPSAPSAPAATAPDGQAPDTGTPIDPLLEVLEPPAGGDGPAVTVGVGGRLGDNTASVEVTSEPSVSIDLGPVQVGEPAPAPEDDGVQVDLGTPLGDTTVSLP